MRRRVRWLSLIFLCVFDLVWVCVLVLTCTAQLTPARGRHAKKATNRRRRLFPVNILLDSLPDSSLLLMQEPCQRVGNPREHSTALILRDLAASGNEKVKFVRNIICFLTHYGNNHIHRDYLGSVPFSNPATSYCQGTANEGKIFHISEFAFTFPANASVVLCKMFSTLHHFVALAQKRRHVEIILLEVRHDGAAHAVERNYLAR